MNKLLKYSIVFLVSCISIIFITFFIAIVYLYNQLPSPAEILEKSIIKAKINNKSVEQKEAELIIPQIKKGLNYIPDSELSDDDRKIKKTSEALYKYIDDNLINAKKYKLDVCNNLGISNSNSEKSSFENYFRAVATGEKPDPVTQSYFAPIGFIIVNTYLKEYLKLARNDSYEYIFNGLPKNELQFFKQSKLHAYIGATRTYYDLIRMGTQLENFTEQSRLLMIMSKAATKYPQLLENKEYKDICYEIENNFNEMRQQENEMALVSIQNIFSKLNIDYNKILEKKDFVPAKFNFLGSGTELGWLGSNYDSLSITREN